MVSSVACATPLLVERHHRGLRSGLPPSRPVQRRREARQRGYREWTDSREPMSRLWEDEMNLGGGVPVLGLSALPEEIFLNFARIP